MKFSRELLKGSAAFVVLQTLSLTQPVYGYQLSKEIKSHSSDIFEFAEGTLYPLLYRLEDNGLVESFIQKTSSGKDRRYYQLTPQGVVALEEKTPEIQQFIQGLQLVLNSANV